MDEKTEKQVAQVTDLHRAIGQYVVVFEHMVEPMRTGVIRFLAKNGLKETRYSHILLSHLTAGPMKDVFGSFVYEIIGSRINATEEKIINGILNSVQKQIEFRNKIIHGTWYIGFENLETMDFSKAYGIKRKRFKKGVKVEEIFESSEYFDEMSLECRKVSNLVRRLYNTVSFGEEISNNFVISESGEVFDTKNSNAEEVITEK